VPAFEPHVGTVEAVVFSPEGRHLLTANPDGSLGLFRLATAGKVFRVP
jgi:hypothetical protein